MIYWVIRFLVRRIFRWTIRIRSLGLPIVQQPGGYILACSHVSHLDPFCLSAILPRKVGWMARIEFYRQRWSAWMLQQVGAFPVNRQGVPVSAIRTALQKLGQGEVVGVFAEGEIKEGDDSVLRGGPIKRGVCLLAQHSEKPVLPCVILGTEKLNTLDPWLPAWRGRLWVACGEPIAPVKGVNRKAARAQMAAQIEASLQQLYLQLCEEFGLEDSVLP